MQFIVVIVKYFCGAKDCCGTPTVLVGIDFAICVVLVAKNFAICVDSD